MEFAVKGPRLVLVAGGSASGKTALVEELARQLGPRRAVVLCHDWYYIDLSHRPLREREAFDFDAPGALDTQRLLADLRRLLAGEPIAAPVYRFTDHCRDSATRAIEPRPFLLLDGLHVLADPALRALADHRVFVDTPAALRLRRRIDRDHDQRGRSEASVCEQWQASVLPAHQRWVQPSREHADRVFDGAANLQENVRAFRDLLGDTSG